ncbi:MAG: hypothetical protein AAF531_23805 [Actinomycetota bacterium]
MNPNPWTHIVTAGPWPNRIGRRCQIVPEPVTPIYPWAGKGPNEAVLLIEDDPYTPLDANSTDQPSWSCVLDADDIQPTHNSASHNAGHDAQGDSTDA